jgi:hypothetical protein
VAPANTASVLVSVSGVLQDPTTYSVSGLTLTFSAAPPSGTGNISCRYLGIPASGVTTTAYRTVTEFTATAGQTTFTPASYTVGFIDVYRNGTRLGTADFTATNGTTVVLATAASSGDLVTTESFLVSSVVNAIPATTGAVTTAYLLDGAVTTAKIADANVTTAKIADANVTPAKLSQPFTSGTAVTPSAVTFTDFTGIPSWVKRITVMFNGVSLNNTANIFIQLGTISGFASTGYTSTSITLNNSSGSAGASSTNGFLVFDGTASYVFQGSCVINLVSSNSYVSSHSYLINTTNIVIGSGSISLGGTLNSIRIISSDNTGTFDAGTINILYE